MPDTTANGRPVSLYLATPNPASKQAALWQAGRPHDAAIMARLGSVPTARWCVGQDADVRMAVHAYTAAAAQAGALPVLVAYNLPDRDAGYYSKGGTPDSTAYSAWITAVAHGIGKLPAMLILEPDALAHLELLPVGAQTIRCDLLRAALSTLRTFAPSTAVYIDAGHPGWQTPATMAKRLRRAGGDTAAGFSLNVSNFCATEDSIAYGTELSRLLGGKHFVIDTSRNGNGPAPDGSWCNPSGRALGILPALETRQPLVDAYLWVKVPGESDGGSGPAVEGTPPPPAGRWWPEYTLELARNAGW